MNKLARYSREREDILYSLRNERRLTSEQISKETSIKLYKVRKHLKTLLENKVIDRETSWYDQFSYTWLYRYCKDGKKYKLVKVVGYKRKITRGMLIKVRPYFKRIK